MTMAYTTAGLLLIVIGLNSLSQLFFKSLFSQESIGWNWKALSTLLSDWRLSSGILAQLGATVFWWWLLSKQPLSVLFPVLTGGMFIAIVLGSAGLFGETLGIYKIAGIAIIWIGLTILSQT